MAKTDPFTGLPIIECEVVFLTEEDGGRKGPFPNGMLSGNIYRPHLVVGDPNQRIAPIDEHNRVQEEYLGIAFSNGPNVVQLGRPLQVELVLIYYPNIDYHKLVPNATFTIREGSKIVGYGGVISALPNTA